MKKHHELRREIKRKHHQSMLDSGYVLCPECGGEGECEYERPVVDYTNGGYLEGYMDTCDTCDGEGYINE
jgi:DnaJ-class molecular chaperone